MTAFKSAWEFCKANKMFLFALITIHAIYFFCALHFEGICNGDSDEYLLTAENLKYHGEVYNWVWKSKLDPFFYTLRPPLYGVFIFLLKLIWDNDYFVLFVQNLLSIGNWLLLIHLSRLLKHGYKLELPIIICLLLIPSVLIMVNTIGADWMLQLWLTVALYYFTKFMLQGKWSYFAGYNGALALSVLTKPVMMYFWIPNLLIGIYFYYRQRDYKVLVCSLIMPLVVFGWSLRNQQKTGLFHYSSIKVQNILDLNAGAVLIKLHGAEVANSVKTTVLLKSESIGNYAEKCDFIVENATSIIKENPVIYTSLHVKGMLNFMLSIGRYDLKNFFNTDLDGKEISIFKEIEKRGLLNFIPYYFNSISVWFTAFFLLAFTWNVIILTGLFVICFDKSFPIIIKCFLLTIIFYSAFVCGPAGDVRFKIAVLSYLLLAVPYFYKKTISK